MRWQNNRGMGYKMAASNILPFTNDIWDCSYNQIISIHKTTTTRKWDPPIVKQLLHLEITDDTAPISPAHVATINLNNIYDTITIQMKNGPANMILKQICQVHAWNGRMKNWCQKLFEGNNYSKALEECKWLTVGVLVLNGQHALAEDIVDLIKQKIVIKQTKVDDAAKKCKLELLKQNNIINSKHQEKGPESLNNL